MPRAARIIVPGYPHHVTQRGNNREPVFNDVGDYFTYLKLLEKFCTQYQVKVWAWCLMPNHVHLLAVPEDEDSLAKAMGSVSLVYTQQQNLKQRRSGRLWQNRYFSCVVGQDDYLIAAARYIELNPLRAGQARRPEEWPWSSARHHLLGRSDPLVKCAFPGFPGSEAWRQLLATADPDVEGMRKATSSGRPFADAELVARLERQLGKRLTPRPRGRPRKSTPAR